MADNVAITPGAGVSIATRAVTYSGDAVQAQAVGLVTFAGADDAKTVTDVPAGGGVEATALRVTLASDSTGLVSVDDNGGSLTVDGTVAVSTNTEIGIVTETAPATDTASSGLNGRLQRIAQRLTSLIALLPTSIGQKAAAGSTSVVLASDQPAIPVSQPGLSGGILQSVTTVMAQSLAITSNTKADPTVVTTATHGLASTDTVTISGSDSVPTLDGARVVTVTAPTTFTVPVNVSTGQTFAIASNTLANPTIVTVAAGHLLKAGTTAVTIAGSNSVPSIDGAQTATYINATTFSVPVNVTTAGTAGTVNYGRAGTTGTVTIAARPLPATPLAGRATMLVQANAANTANIYLGSSTVTADTAATGGILLLPGQSIPIALAAAVLLYACSTTAGQLVRTFEVAA